MSVSNPLPLIEIERPSADRGADDVRDHLDALRCTLCDCPDVDEILVEIPWTGKEAFRPVCKGHAEHPEHPGFTEDENPTEYRFCPECNEVAPFHFDSSEVCMDCWLGMKEEERRERFESATGSEA